jgi:hypothetical protein
MNCIATFTFWKNHSYEIKKIANLRHSVYFRYKNWNKIGKFHDRDLFFSSVMKLTIFVGVSIYFNYINIGEERQVARRERIGNWRGKRTDSEWERQMICLLHTVGGAGSTSQFAHLHSALHACRNLVHLCFTGRPTLVSVLIFSVSR